MFNESAVCPLTATGGLLNGGHEHIKFDMKALDCLFVAVHFFCMAVDCFGTALEHLLFGASSRRRCIYASQGPLQTGIEKLETPAQTLDRTPLHHATPYFVTRFF